MAILRPLLRYQDKTTVVEGSGADTGASKLGLVCRNGRFVATEDEVRTQELENFSLSLAVLELQLSDASPQNTDHDYNEGLH